MWAPDKNAEMQGKKCLLPSERNWMIPQNIKNPLWVLVMFVNGTPYALK